MLRPGRVLSHDISGTLQEELTKCFSRRRLEGGRFERGPHVLQPGAPLGGADAETRVRFAQAQPPPVLSLRFIASQELDQESGELVDGAPEALARE